jgi:hypothetical protein
MDIPFPKDLGVIPVRLDENGWGWVFWPDGSGSALPPLYVNVVTFNTVATEPVVMLNAVADTTSQFLGGLFFPGAADPPKTIVENYLLHRVDGMVDILNSKLPPHIAAKYSSTGTTPNPKLFEKHNNDLKVFIRGLRAFAVSDKALELLQDPAMWAEAATTIYNNFADEVIGQATDSYARVIGPVVRGLLSGVVDGLGIEVAPPAVMLVTGSIIASVMVVRRFV